MEETTEGKIVGRKEVSRADQFEKVDALYRRREIEVGEAIIDTMSELKGQVALLEGRLTMSAPYIERNPTCNSPACFGGWCAHFFKTPLDADEDRFFGDGAKALLRELGFDVRKSSTAIDDLRESGFLDMVGPFWHNKLLHLVFHDADAYTVSTHNGYSAAARYSLTFSDAADLWIDCGVRMVKGVRV